MKSETKNKLEIATYLFLAVIFPIAWLFISNFVLLEPNFNQDVYLDKQSIEIIGDSDVSIILNLKNDSVNCYGGKFLHINAVKNGQSGGRYVDYELHFIGAHSTHQIYVSTNWSKEEIEDIVVSVRDDENRSAYGSLSDHSQGGNIQIINYVVWSALILFSLALLVKAHDLQIKNYLKYKDNNKKE